MTTDSEEMAQRVDRKQSPPLGSPSVGGLGPDWVTLLGILCVAGAALYLGTERWPETPDGLFHLQRVRALSEAIEGGIFYPRWFPDFAFEYGHPIFNYYAPLSYYPPALLHLSGFDVLTATRLSLALFFGLSGGAMFLLLHAWVEWPAALAGVVIYLAFPYRLYDLFVRGALPEFSAFLWLPLLILLALHVGQGAGSGPSASTFSPKRQVPLVTVTALAWAALILTHNLTALMAALATGIALLIIGLVHRQEARPVITLAMGLLSLLLGALLVAWYVFPALWESSWVAIGVAPISYGFGQHFADWSDLFDWSFVFTYPEAADPTVALPGWTLLPMVAGLLALPILWKTRLRLPLLLGLSLTIGALWLTTSSSAFLWQATAPVLGKLQFPWRWQSIVAVGIALLVGVLIQWGAATLSRRIDHQPEPADGDPGGADGAAGRSIGWILSAAVMGYVLFNAVAGLGYAEVSYSDAEITREQMWAFDAEFGQIGMTWTGEFLPRWVQEQRWAIGGAPSDGSSAAGTKAVDLSVTPLRLEYLSASYAVDAVEATRVRWHRFYFPAWRLQVDGETVKSVADGNLGLLSAVIPAGEHRIDLDWVETPATVLGRFAAAGAWSLILLGLILTRARRRWLIGWLLLGMTAAVIVLAPVEDGQVVDPIGVDFGVTRLEASTTGLSRDGREAFARLHWLIQEPSPPLTTFVHLMNPAGIVVAQNDAPLAGAYTPAERWQPGLLLDHTHLIPLPADLPPGQYRLKAGLYEPGQSDRPIVPTGQTDARVDIGTVDVTQ